MDEGHGRGWPEAEGGVLPAQSARQPLPTACAPLGGGGCTPEEAAVGPGFLIWGRAERPGPL